MSIKYIRLNGEHCSEDENQIMQLIIDLYNHDNWINTTSEDIDTKLHLSAPKLTDIALNVHLNIMI